MRAKSWLLCCLMFAPAVGSAAGLRPELESLSSLPMHRAPAVAVERVGTTTRRPGQPLQFAVAAPLSLTLQQGLWDEAGPGIARWRSRVMSSGALALGLEFSRFELPEAAELWIYDADGRQVQGPYTRADRSAEGQLWTALVPGSTAVLELRVPAASRDAVKLALAQVDHAFIDITKADIGKAGESGSCNIDVICSDGNAWRQQIRSVARITIGNHYLCSGELLNNARGDGDPLMITANHCEIGQEYPASSVIAYWNYQASQCGGARDGSLAQNQSGATLLAGDVGSDFSLIRLTRKPDASINAYYSGWDAGGVVPSSGVSIHHPQGEEKRISTYTTPPAKRDVCIDSGLLGSCNRLVHAWEISWARGITETGSSGGGLWNQQGRLIGTLSGGNVSCSYPGGNDYFARLESAFTAKASASGQLKAWLDPDNSGVRSMAGLDSSTAPGSGGGDGEDSGGGGSCSLFGLAVLAALANMRRRRILA